MCREEEKGITLVALVITIIIIIILSTITLNMAFGDNGLIKQVQKAKDMTANSIASEQEGMNSLLGEYSNIMNGGNEIEEPNPPEKDETPPVITVTSGGTTSNSVKVNVSAVDNESGMVDSPTYTYSIKVTGTEDSTYNTPSDAQNITTNTYIFTGLTQGTSYYVKVEVNGDKAGNIGIGYLTNQVTGEIPDGIEQGSITFGSVIWSRGKASVTVNTSTSYTIQYQVNTTAGTWNIIENGETVNNLNHNDTVYARLYDGTNHGEDASVTIKDETPPTISNISLSSTENSVTVTVTASDGESGIENYTYKINGGSQTSNTTGSYTFTGLSASTTYEVGVTVIDKANNPVTESKSIQTKEPPSIPETTSYVGYYADVDGNGTVDGIIYADMAFSKSGTWNPSGNSSYDSYGTYGYTKQSNLKKYKVDGTHSENGFGLKGIVKPNGGSGNERFYVISLSDVDSNLHCWYYSAYGYGMSDYASTTSVDFGKGEQNTINMRAKWNSSAYGSQNGNSSNTDMWGLSTVQSGNWNGSNGWYVLSRGEWAAFGDTFNITNSNYSNYGLSYCYWSSSQSSRHNAWGTHFSYGRMSDNGLIDNFDAVRLGTTF